MPLGHESARDAAVPQTGKIVSTKRHQHWWRATICSLPCSVRTMEMQPVGHEQDAARPFPDRLEPSSLSARMEQRRAMAMLGEATDPSLNLVAIEWRIQPRPAKPLLTETVVALGIIDASAIPGTRRGRCRVHIEWPQPLDDPAWRDMNLGFADRRLMRAQRHWRISLIEMAPPSRKGRRRWPFIQTPACSRRASWPRSATKPCRERFRSGACETLGSSCRTLDRAARHSGRRRSWPTSSRGCFHATTIAGHTVDVCSSLCPERKRKWRRICAAPLLLLMLPVAVAVPTA